MAPNLVMVVTASCAVAVVALKKIDGYSLASSLCEYYSRQPVCVPDVARDAFAQTEVPEVVLTSGHTHPTAAASRNVATRTALSMATYCGARLFSLQMSKSDQRKGLAGTRAWYWAKDTNVENRSDVANSDDLNYVCDTDYYIDMVDLLTREVKPTVLYTAVPSSAASNSGEETTFFESDGSLTTLVSGGGTYHHHLWDYAADSLRVERRFLGICYKMVTYAVERKQVTANRQLILLAPIREFSWFGAFLATFIISGKTLQRFQPIVKASDGSKFVRFFVHTKDGTQVTTSRPGSTLCATVPSHLDAAIATVARLGTTNLMLPTVASWLGGDSTTCKPASAVLTEYHRLVVGAKVPTVYPVEKGVRAYQYEPQNFDPDARPKLEAFMSPLVHKAFAPIQNAAGERRAVKGRIEDLRAEEPAPHAFRDQCIQEFVDLVANGAVLCPVDYETTAEKQTSASQIQSLKRAVLNGPHVKRVLKCFIKSEAYGDVKDPRIISTYNDADKLDFGGFTLALSAHMKQFKWYGPGMTPEQVAIRVAEICENALEFVNVSDLERMDGTVTYLLRQIDRGVMMKTFVNHRAALNELLKRNVDNLAVLPNGTRTKQGSAHGSGCPGTSVLQTARAAFNSYLGFRHTVNPRTGACFTPCEAFKALGIHSGDDGLDADLPVASHRWASKRVGLRLEACIVLRGEPGVNFLARYYSSEVWTGRTDSMCDVKRQLAKFHTTVRLPHGVTPEHKLVEKAMAYLATDSNTPVVGAYCKRVLVLSSYRPKVLHGIGNWWSKFDGSVQYPNDNADGWMDVEFSRLFPEFDHTLFNQWLASSGTVEEVLEPPLCAEPEPAKPAKVPVVVDGDILAAREAEPADEEQPPTTTVEKRKRSRGKRKSGDTTPSVAGSATSSKQKGSKPGAKGRSKERNKSRPKPE